MVDETASEICTLSNGSTSCLRASRRGQVNKRRKPHIFCCPVVFFVTLVALVLVTSLSRVFVLSQCRPLCGTSAIPVRGCTAMTSRGGVSTATGGNGGSVGSSTSNSDIPPAVSLLRQQQQLDGGYGISSSSRRGERGMAPAGVSPTHNRRRPLPVTSSAAVDSSAAPTAPLSPVRSEAPSGSGGGDSQLPSSPPPSVSPSPNQRYLPSLCCTTSFFSKTTKTFPYVCFFFGGRAARRGWLIMRGGVLADAHGRRRGGIMSRLRIIWQEWPLCICRYLLFIIGIRNMASQGLRVDVSYAVFPSF